MPTLFVDQTIEIQAPAPNVWNALTRRADTDEWAAEFSRGGPPIHIESDWQLGSPVLWKNAQGTVLVEGQVTALEPHRLLRFTVFDTRAERPAVAETDGITFALEEHAGATRLRVRQGDFASLPDGEKYRDLSARVWERVLPRIKALAEADDMAERPTCGKGLAENSALPARFGDVLAAVAENLELHLLVIDANDDAGRQEREAYVTLVREHRQLAVALAAAAQQMAGYRGLTMAHHHDQVWADPRFAQACQTLAEREQDLLALLQKRVQANQQMLAQMKAASHQPA